MEKKEGNQKEGGGGTVYIQTYGVVLTFSYVSMPGRVEMEEQVGDYRSMLLSKT